LGASRIVLPNQRADAGAAGSAQISAATASTTAARRRFTARAPNPGLPIRPLSSLEGVTLTVGTGPFGQRPAGSFNFDPPEGVRYLEPSPRWMRARLGGRTVADSRRTMLLHAAGSLPHLLFPEEDLRLDLVPDDALRRHEAPELAGLVELDWNAMDEWLEEDEPAFGHPRDPYHRLDVRATSRRVRVSLNGETLADSSRTVALFEASLPTRWYFPREDVRMDLLEPSARVTTCAYKGHAAHLSLPDEPDVAWTYEEPTPEMEPIRGRVAFYDERVDVEVDGERQERPVTPWGRDYPKSEEKSEE
jgi:uncharacterized protein (DUF427 family)